MGGYCKTPEGYTFYDGPVYTVGWEGTDDFYVFELEEMANWFKERRNVHKMTLGSAPTDGGNLFMTPEERDEVLNREPELKKFIRQVLGSYEFINGVKRYCFWLVDASPKDIKRSKILHERVEKVKAFRLASVRGKTQRQANCPHLFAEMRQPATDYMLIPRHSSSKRYYIPMGYMSSDVIVTDAAYSLPKATPYHFGIITSRVHMAWVRRVCGRLRDDYRYNNTVGYNTFCWPKSNPWQVKRIEDTGQKILDVRAKYPECTFADLYDEVSMPPDLRKAHNENDAAVLEAYGLPVDMDEEDIIDHMFKLYYEALAENKEQECRK